MTGAVEGEYVGENGRVAVKLIYLFHYVDERGSIWGFAAGDWKDGTYAVQHPKFHRWRFVGPEVPTKPAQGCAIMVWRFSDAPGELRCLSPHGGDEDWVALCPSSDTPSWAAADSPFGYGDVSEHIMEDGRVVLIGAHA
jgi:hypothetical protein